MAPLTLTEAVLGLPTDTDAVVVPPTATVAAGQAEGRGRLPADGDLWRVEGQRGLRRDLDGHAPR